MNELTVEELRLMLWYLKGFTGAADVCDKLRVLIDAKGEGEG